MGHYDEQRKNDMRCYVSDQIAEHCDEQEILCQECQTPVDEVLVDYKIHYICPNCELEVDIDE